MDYIRQLNSFKIHRTVKPIGPMAISLYLALFELDNELGFAEWFCSTFGRLSESAGGLTENQFYRARNELLQNGYIEYRKSSTPRKAGHYRLIPLDDCEALSIDERKANDSPMIGERKANDSIKQTKTKLKPNETEKETHSAQARRFALFWSSYPKKRNKGDAEKAWKQLKPDDGLTDTMLVAIEQQKQTQEWQKNGGQYIPYPASWLRAKAWEDEVRQNPADKSKEVQTFGVTV